MTTVFENGTVRTLEAHRPTASTFAVRDGRIVAVGEDEVAGLTDIHERVDLHGRTVIPGLIDVHNHHMIAGRKDLFEFKAAPTLGAEALFEAVEAYARELPEGAWITGGSVGSGLFPELDSPEALRRFDEVAHGHPAVLTDDSLHNRWANSLALEIAGIGDGTPDPRGGSIARDAEGRATGILYEAGGMMVEKARERIAPFSSEDLERSSERAIEMLHGYGITAFQDAATSFQTQQALQSLDERGRLKAWVVTASPVEEFIFGIEPIGEEVIFAMEETRSTHHRPDFIKIFLDGVPPAKTAAFLEPYLDDSGCSDCNFGYMTMPQEDLASWLLRTAERGISAKIHATGDASARAVLDAVEQVRRAGYHEPIYHIAHGQFIEPSDLPRFRELGVVADISPALWYPNVITESFKSVMPAERAAKVQPNRDLLDHGALVAAGSDWPVAVSPDPWPAIYSLITRQDPTRTMPGALWPEQAVTRQEALEFATINPARALGIDDVTGSISVGKSADFLVLDFDPMTCELDELLQAQALQTWFAGEKVFDRS